MGHLFADYFEPDQIFVLGFGQIVPGSVASAYSPVLKEWLGATAPLQLLFKTSGASDVKGFHRACDGKANTLVIVRSEEGNIFGGFAVPAWGSVSECKPDPTQLTFIFVLKNTFGDPPTRFPKKDDGRAIFCDADGTPVFGGESGPEIDLGGRYNKPFVHIKGDYIDKLGRGTSAFVSRCGGEQKIELESYEVWAAAGPPTPCE
jgi:hypothetical protein